MIHVYIIYILYYKTVIKNQNIIFVYDTYFNQRPRQLLDDEAFPVLDRFVELGGNFIDTADMYNDGASEELICRWLKR